MVSIHNDRKVHRYSGTPIAYGSWLAGQDG